MVSGASVKKILKGFIYTSQCYTADHQGKVTFDPRGITRSNFVCRGPLVDTTYQNSSHGLKHPRQEDCSRFDLLLVDL